jgi:hypothetical protein
VISANSRALAVAKTLTACARVKTADAVLRCRCQQRLSAGRRRRLT